MGSRYTEVAHWQPAWVWSLSHLVPAPAYHLTCCPKASPPDWKVSCQITPQSSCLPETLANENPAKIVDVTSPPPVRTPQLSLVRGTRAGNWAPAIRFLFAAYSQKRPLVGEDKWWPHQYRPRITPCGVQWMRVYSCESNVDWQDPISMQLKRITTWSLWKSLKMQSKSRHTYKYIIQ